MEEVVSPYGIGTALVLGLWAYIAIVSMLAPNISFHEPIVAGAVTGIIVGNIPLGLAVGGTLMIISLGMHTYGGATMKNIKKSFPGCRVTVGIGVINFGFYKRTNCRGHRPHLP